MSMKMMTSTMESRERQIAWANRQVRIGLVGCGNRGVRCFGTMLANRPDVSLVALADTNSVRLNAAAEILGYEGYIYGSVREMLLCEDLDGVVITTPDYLHDEHVVLALEAGVRHVLVDKPLAINTDGCLRVVNALRDCACGGKPAQVALGFNMRHKPLIAKIKEIIDQGEVGDLMLMENREFYSGGRTYMSRWNRKYEWSGGLWVHKGSHDFDVFNWWNSSGTPVRVFASGGIDALRADKVPFEIESGKPVGPNCATCVYAGICPDYSLPVGGQELFDDKAALEDGYLQDLCICTSDKDVHDNGIAIVEYDNDVRASHLECFVCNFDDRPYTVVGDRGTLMARMREPTQIVLKPRWGMDRIIEVSPPPAGSHGGADPLLLENFVAGIRRQAPHSSSVRDGLRAVAVGEAAEIAWRQNRVVEIAESVDLYDQK